MLFLDMALPTSFWSRPRADRGLRYTATRMREGLKCIPYNRCVQNFIQIGLDLAVRGPKTRFGVKTENSLVVKISKMV